jgi:hypothetical protein
METPVSTDRSKPADQRDHGKVAAWIVLLSMGGTSMAFNIYHAVNGNGHLVVGLALLYGIAPVLAAMGLSHMGASRRDKLIVQVIIFAVMIGAMVLSANGIGEVLKATAGPQMCWVFGGVLDAASLTALWMILNPPPVIVPGVSESAPDPEPAAAAGPEVPPGSDPEFRPGSDPGTPPRNSARKQTRKRGATSARKPRRTSVPPVPDMDTESWALHILAADPEMSGSELGRRMGKSDRYGRDLINRLSASVPEPGKEDR